MSALNMGQKHLLRLIKKGRGEDGWTKVSPMVLPLMKTVPEALAVTESTEEGWGRAKLTEAGENIIDWI